MNVFSRKKALFVLFVLVTMSVVFSVLMYGSGDYVPRLSNLNSIFVNNFEFQSALRSHFEFCKKQEPDHILLIPNDTILDTRDETQLKDLYWRYINTIQVLCRNQTRFGSMQDGGKEICVDELYKPTPPCLVYSFGSNFQYDFETAIIQKYHCEVHTFDPSHPIQGNIPHGINFHLTGLSDHTFTNEKQWSMSTVSDIKKSLGHVNRTIDILKIDVEGAEWVALPQIFKSGVLTDVKQLSIEIHYGRMGPKEHFQPWGGVALKEQLKILRSLYEVGFHIFMHEHNLFSVEPFNAEFPSITTVNEITLKNVNWTERMKA